MLTNSSSQCFVSSVRSGLLFSLGTVSGPGQYATFTEFALRAVFFDISFWVVISVIALNLVLGIIVDTFSEVWDVMLCDMAWCS